MKPSRGNHLQPVKRSTEGGPPAEPHSRSPRAHENGESQLHHLTKGATSRHQSDDAQRFLLDISAEFVSRDYETTLKRLAIRTVPFFADFCFFDVLSADGTIRRVSWAHADSVKHRLLDMAVEFVPARSSTNHPVSKVMRTGESEFVPEVERCLDVGRRPESATLGAHA